MTQVLDLKEINEGSLILISNLLYLVLEYDFYIDSKEKPNHSFVVLSTDKIISWYSCRNLDNIVNISGDSDYEQRKETKMQVM